MTEGRGVRPARTPEETEKGTLWVVSIGIDEYPNWRRLRNAKTDAVGVHDLLVESFGARPVADPLLDVAATKYAIEALVIDVLHTKLGAADSLFFFFAGHGYYRKLQRTSTGFVIPYDAKHKTEEAFSSYIKLETLLNDLAQIPARHVFAVIDSCHSGFALPVRGGDRGSPESHAANLESKDSRKALSSAGEGETAADEGPIPGHSLFTGTLIQGLRDGAADTSGKGIVTAYALCEYVHQQVAQAPESQQNPEYGPFRGDKKGQLVLRLNRPKHVPEPELIPPLLRMATSAIQSSEIEDATVLLQTVLRLEPDHAGAQRTLRTLDPAYQDELLLKVRSKRPAVDPRPLSPLEVQGYSSLIFLGVGIDKYLNWPQLSDAASGAKAVADTLSTRFGFDTKLLLDRDAYRSNIEDHLQRVGGDEDSLFVFYFSGHADTWLRPDESEVGFLVPVEAPMEGRSALLPLADLFRIFEDNVKARHALFILDACVSGLPSGPHGRGRPGNARWVITAGAPDQVVLSAGELSLFTSTLIEGLTSDELQRPMYARDLMSYVERHVPERARRKKVIQTPSLGVLPGHGGATIVLHEIATPP